MGLDQSREKLYRVRNNVQDFEGITFVSALFISIPRAFRDVYLILRNREFKVDRRICRMCSYDSLIQNICMSSSAFLLRDSRLLFLILCRFEVTMSLIVRL